MMVKRRGSRQVNRRELSGGVSCGSAGSGRFSGQKNHLLTTRSGVQFNKEAFNGRVCRRSVRKITT